MALIVPVLAWAMRVNIGIDACAGRCCHSNKETSLKLFFEDTSDVKLESGHSFYQNKAREHFSNLTIPSPVTGSTFRLVDWSDSEYIKTALYWYISVDGAGRKVELFF